MLFDRGKVFLQRQQVKDSSCVFLCAFKRSWETKSSLQSLHMNSMFFGIQEITGNQYSFGLQETKWTPRISHVQHFSNPFLFLDIPQTRSKSKLQTSSTSTPQNSSDYVPQTSQKVLPSKRAKSQVVELRIHQVHTNTLHLFRWYWTANFTVGKCRITSLARTINAKC